MTAKAKYFLVLIIIGALYLGASAAQVSNSSTQTQRGAISGIVVRAGSGEPVRKALVSLRVVNQSAAGLGPAVNTSQNAQRGAQEAQGQQGNRGQGNGNRGQQGGNSGNGGNNNGGQRQGQQNRGGGAGQSSLSTADDGTFVFSNVNPGQYRISVERDGYIRQEFGQRSWTGPGTIITVAPGQILNNVSFQLVPAGTIAGRIVDEHGEALAGIQVQALSYTYRDGNRTLAPSRQVQTNDLGEYRLYWLTPGEYYVTAIPNNALDRLLQTVATIDLASVVRGGNAREALAQAVRQPTSTTAAPEESYAPTYFPGAIDPDAASPVKLAAAAEIRGIDFTLKPVRTLKLRGRVIAVDVPPTPQQAQAQAQQQAQGGQRGGRGGGVGGGGRGGGQNILDLLGGRGGARGVQVVALRSDAPSAGGRGGRRGGPGGLDQNRASVGADGTFEISNVIPGSYTVIGVQQANNQVFSAQAKVEAGGADVENITLALRPGISITGQIYVDGQTPPQNFRMDQLRVTLSPVEDVPLGNANAQVKADGTFVLNNVGAMTYRVSVNGLGNGSYLAAGRYGNAEALNDLLQASDQSLPLALQLGFSPARVDGVVNDNRDQPYPGVTCVLVPAARNRIDLYKTASTDQYGRFTFANIVPGDYKVFAWEDIPQGAYMDSAYVSKFDDRGVAAHVEKGGGVSVQVRMIPAER